jgi:membrane protease subunit (stomatin/prohibitin family)
VAGRVQRRQASKWDQQDAQQYEEQQQQAPPPEAEDDATAQLQNLAALHTQGVLTDEEFAAAKAKILGI